MSSGGEIKEVRESLKLSQKELAEKSGVALEEIIALEDGTVRISPKKLAKLAQVLGSSIFMIRRSDTKEVMAYDQLLKTIGYQKLMEMITPAEVQEAKLSLKQFIRDFNGLDSETLSTFAYLFGIKQGIHEMYGGRKCLVDHMTNIYRMGKQHGIHLTLLLAGKGATSTDISQRLTPNLDIKAAPSGGDVKAGDNKNM